MPTVQAPLRIALWSGPRNVSTALMRSFQARGDCAVSDEPLYAHYLAVTGLDHPGREQVLQSQPKDWREVVARLTGPVPGGLPVWYQKHMAHHLLPDVGRDWLDGLRHALLIREPAAMLASLAQVLPQPRLVDTGLPQQWELYCRLADRGGRPPPVVDSRLLLSDPAGVLSELCAALGLDYRPAMLHWPAGPRAEDGVWAPHWYAAVERSTGFAAPREEAPQVPESLRRVLEEAEEIYARLRPVALEPRAPAGGGREATQR
jgi:hypothetical protein